MIESLRVDDEGTGIPEQLQEGDAVVHLRIDECVLIGHQVVLGLEEVTIEIDPELVDEAESMAERLGSEALFTAGNFVPSGCEEFWDTADDIGWQAVGGPDGYQLLDIDPDDLDVIYAYPWPGEDQAFADLFERIARPGALLLTYHGMEDLALRRKV